MKIRILLVALTVLLSQLLLVNSTDVSSGAPAKIKPLDHPANPYRDRYSHWDRKVYAVLKEASDRRNLWDADLGHRAAEHGTTTYIDRNGFLIPVLLEDRKRHELSRSSGRERELAFPDAYRIGVQPQATNREYEEYTREQDKVVAAFYPEIPKWIYEKTPATATFLPDGNIHCQGRPGVWQQHQRKLPLGTRWPNRSIGNQYFSENYLFDPDGNLITASTEWITPLLYTGKKFQEITKANLSGGQLVFEPTRDGYWLLTTQQGETVQVFDFNGTVIPGKALLPQRDKHNFTRLPAAQIRRLYEAQQALKAETPAAP